MPWARLDDRFPVNAKVRPLTDAAFRLHVSALCWTAENLTDGHIENVRLRYVSDVRQPARSVRELVGAGLWLETAGGWHINDWHEYNPSREEVVTKRKADAEKKRKQRLRNLGLSPGDEPGDSQRDTPGDSLGESPEDSYGDPPWDDPGDSPVPAHTGSPRVRPDPAHPKESFGSLNKPLTLSNAPEETDQQPGGIAEPIWQARKRAANGSPVKLEGWDIDSVSRVLATAVDRFDTDRDDAYERIRILAGQTETRNPGRLLEQGAWDWAGDELLRMSRDRLRREQSDAELAAQKAHAAEVDQVAKERRRRIHNIAEADPDGWAQAQVEAAAELEAEGSAALPALVKARALDIHDRAAAS